MKLVSVQDSPDEIARIYLDNNATTPLDPVAAERMLECWTRAFANPGSSHSWGRHARTALEDSRESLAGILDAEPSELIFTSGGTESISMAIHGLTFGRRGLIATTDGEHPAVLEACRQAQYSGLERISIPVDADGLIERSELDNLPWSRLKLICLILAHNETGVIQPVEEISDLCERHQVPLLLDAVQAVGKIPVKFRQLRATALAFGAHKFHGPRGAGGLLLRRGVRIPPLLAGGHQESGRRAGTEPVPLIVGMATALQRWHEAAEHRTRTVQTLRDRLQNSLSARCGSVIIHGRRAPRLSNTLSMAFPGIPGEALLVSLHLAEIACSLGSTCASGSAEPAKSLLAMGVPPEIAGSSVRFSLSILNTDSEIQAATDRIVRIVRRLRDDAACRL